MLSAFFPLPDLKTAAKRLPNLSMEALYFLAPSRRPFQLGPSGPVQLEKLLPFQADALFQLVDANRNYLAPYVPWVNKVQKTSDAAAEIRRWAQLRLDRNAWAMGIFVEGQLSGMIDMVKAPGDPKAACLGYWIAESAQHHGYVSRAVALCLSHAFTHLGLRSIYIRTAAENRSSARVALRMGFEPFGAPKKQCSSEGLDFFVQTYRLTAEKWKHFSSPSGLQV